MPNKPFVVVVGTDYSPHASRALRVAFEQASRATPAELHVVHVALTADERRIVGVARFVADAARPDRGEAAIAIADEWQHAGLGAALLAGIIERARIAGLRTLTATTLIENAGAARLARSCGFSPTGTDSGYREYELPLRLAA